MMAALQAFAQSEEFVDAVVKSTQAGFGGSGYSVEVFPDGSHRLLWDGQVGNLYRSPGMIVPVPQLNNEEAAEADEEAGISLHDVARFYHPELAERLLESAAE
jgi:aryl-alcohol dehydrogenase-like predicted oxidoreductase